MLELKHRASTVDAQLRYAIAEMRLIQISYKTRTRICEPHDYGRHNNIDRLLIYQLIADDSRAGRETGWRLLDVTKIESLTVLDAIFRGSRQQRDQTHHSWDVVYARVK
jgi:hypothetical protein